MWRFSFVVKYALPLLCLLLACCAEDIPEPLTIGDLEAMLAEDISEPLTIEDHKVMPVEDTDASPEDAGTKALPLKLTQLTTNPGIDNSPTWSPDGRTIAYAASPNVSSRPWEDNSFDIWTIPATGGTPTRLTDYDFICESPKYSPDGSKILYTTKEDINTGVKGIWSIPASGGSRTKVFKGAWANDYDADWSPDGSEIVFISERGASGPGGQNVWIVSSDGSGRDLRRLTFGNPGDDGPDWSPDGSTIAFASSIRSGRADIWTMPAAGGDPIRLTNNPHWGGTRPTYSPDGRWIAFVSDTNGKLGIWVMPAAGGERTLIVEYDVGCVGSPCWSPDGSKIAFTRRPEDGSNASDIWVASNLPINKP